MGYFSRPAVAMLFCLLVHVPMLAQDKKEVYAPTTLIEMSPQIAGEFHRINGKIEGGVANKKLANDLEQRFTEWLENAGNPAETTFEAAHDELLTKLQRVGKMFEAYRSAGMLEKWPALSEPPFPNVVVNVGPTPTVAPVASATSSKTSTAAVAQPASKKPDVPTFAAVAIFILAAISGVAGFRLYPIFFQARVDTYVSSPWERLKKRTVFAFCWLLGGLFLASMVMRAIWMP